MLPMDAAGTTKSMSNEACRQNANTHAEETIAVVVDAKAVATVVNNISRRLCRCYHWRNQNHRGQRRLQSN